MNGDTENLKNSIQTHSKELTKLGSILAKLLFQHTIIRFNGDIRKTKDINKWLISNHFDAIIHLAAIVAIDQVNKDKKKAKISIILLIYIIKTIYHQLEKIKSSLKR